MRWLTWTQCRSAEFRCVSTQVLRLRGVAPPSVSVSQNVSQILRFRWVIGDRHILNQSGRKMGSKQQNNSWTNWLPPSSPSSFGSIPSQEHSQNWDPKNALVINPLILVGVTDMVMLKIPQPTGPNRWGARLAWLLPGGFRWVPLLPSKPSGSLGHLAMWGGHDWKNCVFWVVGGASDAWVTQSLGEVEKNAMRCEDLVSLLPPLSRVRHVMFDVVPACGFRTQLKMISLDQGIFWLCSLSHQTVFTVHTSTIYFEAFYHPLLSDIPSH